MESILLTSTSKTPEVSFDAEKGTLSLKGRSIPEHTVEFYKPLHQWIEEYGQNPQAFTAVEIFVEYYNTSSSKSILDLFKRLENIHKTGHDMLIKWYYEDDDEALLESGEEYESMVDIPFELISVPVDDDDDE
ncbi:MAG: DUF1987 domain-containing protein [Flavobacteriales bacterium]|nr:DUF1987 domain-containing protein [Flavobacteriales bacterium]